MKIQTVKVYVCEGCKQEFKNEEICRRHEVECLWQQKMESKIVVRKAKKEDYPSICDFLSSFAGKEGLIRIREDDELNLWPEQYIDFWSGIIGLNETLEMFQKAVGIKKHHGLALYQSYLAILEDKILGLTLEDHGGSWEDPTEGLDWLMMLLIKSDLDKTTKRVVRRKLWENFYKIVRERKEEW